MTLSGGIYSLRWKPLFRITSTIIQPVDSLAGNRPLARTTVRRSFSQESAFNGVGYFATNRRRFSSMPRPIVYLAEPSPPSRAVLLTAAALGLDIDVRKIDLRSGEHRTEAFRKMNPEHTVPTLDEDGFILWDSHAIMCYLADKYGKTDALYPKDLRHRAAVNRRLHFDSGVLFARLRFITVPLFTGVTNEIPEEKLQFVKEGFEHLNNFLNGRDWLVGDSYTLADISCVTTVTSVSCVAPFDDYSNIKAWVKRCEKTLPGYETLNVPGCKQIHELFRRSLARGKV